MQILEYGTEFRVHIDFNHWRKRNLAAVKKVPGAKYDYNDKTWKIPLTERPVLLKLYQYVQSYSQPKYYKIDTETPEQLGEIKPMPDLEVMVPLSHPEGFGFRPYQENGVAKGLELKRFINGDEQGLGKTLQSLATIHAAALRGEDVFPCLVSPKDEGVGIGSCP